MMKFNLFVVGASALAMAQPVLAQSNEDAAGDAADATADAIEAAEAAAEAATENAPPPPIMLAPAPPPPLAVGPEIEYPTDPRPNERLYRLIKPVDYPVEAWNEGHEGYVGYDIQVSTDGTAERCFVTESSGHALLDKTTCDLVMERLTFEPALAGEDEPIAGTFSGSYTWRKREPEMPQMSITFTYLQDAQGVTSECEFLRMEGDIPERMMRDIERDRERGRLCPGRGTNRGIPYRDENGVPVAKRVTVTFDVVLEDVE